MPLQFILACEIFDIWGINFVAFFPISKGCKFIFVAIGYVSKWVEAQATMHNDSQVVIKLLKKLFN